MNPTPLLPGDLIADLVEDLDATSTGLALVDRSVDQLTQPTRVRIGSELIRIAGANRVERRRPRTREVELSWLHLATRGNWRHQTGTEILLQDQPIGRLVDPVEPTDGRIKAFLDDPQRLKAGITVRIGGETPTVQRIEPLTLREEIPGRPEGYLVPALQVSQRGLNGVAAPHAAGTPIFFAPETPVAVPGPGVERVDNAATGQAGRLLITTGSQPQAGRLATLHFGEHDSDLHMVNLAPEPSDGDGDSLAAYGLAATAPTATGFAILAATAPRPGTTYAIRYALVSTPRPS